MKRLCMISVFCGSLSAVSLLWALGLTGPVNASGSTCLEKVTINRVYENNGNTARCEFKVKPEWKAAKWRFTTAFAFYTGFTYAMAEVR